MSDNSKPNATNEELKPQELEQISGGAFSVFINMGDDYVAETSATDKLDKIG